MHMILIIAGILFILYFLCIALFIGHGTNFYFIWLIAGALLITAGICLKRGILFQTIPGFLKRAAVILICVCGTVFLFVQGCIISGFAADGPDGLDYVIVLGAQMKESGPSKVLKMRLDKAYEYITRNEDTIVIVSGGQGRDEPMSEAQGMFDYLTQKGVKPERIIKEDQSVNTFQNLQFSSEYVHKDMDSVGIITNNFHVFRAVKIAEKAGFKKVYGIAAKSEPFLQFNNMLREFFGVTKDFLAGNL